MNIHDGGLWEEKSVAPKWIMVGVSIGLVGTGVLAVDWRRGLKPSADFFRRF